MVLDLNSNSKLIQPHVTQEPMLRDKVDARALRIYGQTREEVWASAGGARRLGESG